jgi:hypothetical protein
VIVPPYRVFYEVDGEDVNVVSVWHSAQDVTGAHDSPGEN